MPNLIAARRRALITQEELSRLTGLDRVTISRLERGHHKPQFRTMKKIATALGLEPHELFALPQ
jgi:transcriptional regulator with XRE-family HTH domain